MSGRLADGADVPVSGLTEEEISWWLRMEDELRKRVVGQQGAVAAVSKAVRRAGAVKDPSRPLAVFIFVCPSGVGKTELSRALAEFLFGSVDALICFDVSELQDRSRLVGAPPGHGGGGEGGPLTERVRRRPGSVVQFDDIDEAHSDVLDTLLHIVEDGRLTDRQGRTVDFTDTVIIFTTGLGTKVPATAVSLGLQAGEGTECNHDWMRTKVADELRQHFRPRFLMPVHDVIVFDQPTGR